MAAEQVLVFRFGLPSSHKPPPTKIANSEEERIQLVRNEQLVPGVGAGPDNAAAIRSDEMRTIVLSALTALTLSLAAVMPASAANAPWRCLGPAVACADSAPSWRSVSNKRSRRYTNRYERRSGKRNHRSAYRKAAPRRKPTAAPSRRSYSGSGSHHGIASYYGTGTRTASGARFNPRAMTAAHRSLPFGTKVRVTNKRNGRSVVVTINDRGPFIRGRIIDLSTGAADVIGMRRSGLAPVSVEVLGRG